MFGRSVHIRYAFLSALILVGTAGNIARFGSVSIAQSRSSVSTTPSGDAGGIRWDEFGRGQTAVGTPPRTINGREFPIIENEPSTVLPSEDRTDDGIAIPLSAMATADLEADGTANPVGSVTSGFANPDSGLTKASRWIGTWATAAQPGGPVNQTVTDQTMRLIMRITAGGKRCRVRISNTYGTEPLVLGRIQIARRASGADVDPIGAQTLTFAGKSGASIAPGATATSDPIILEIPALSDLAVSIYLPQRTQLTTIHELSKQTSYISTVNGDHTRDEHFPPSRALRKWPFVTGIDVEAPANSFSIVAFGSSLTDGDGTTPDANRRWPNVLSERLQEATTSNRSIGVLNEGIIGNRLLNNSPSDAVGGLFGRLLGESGLLRFRRDVLEQTGVRYVVVGLGINDIAFPGSITSADEAVTAAKLITGYRKLIRLARAQHIKVIGTTIPGFEDAFLGLPPPKSPILFFSPAKERIREEVNNWILQGGEFDSVVDLDAILRDPNHPSRLNPMFDSGDHLHPNDAGNLAEAHAFPLSLFGIKKRTSRSSSKYAHVRRDGYSD